MHKRLKRILSTAVTITTISWSIGLGTLIPLLPVKAAATGITLTDSDNIGFGIDGRDFTVTFTPGALLGATKIYILPSADADGAVAAGNNAIESGDCNGAVGGNGPCTPKGFFNQLPPSGNFTFTLPESEKMDSRFAALSAQAYKACVLYDTTADATTGTNEFACGSEMTPSTVADNAVSDTNAPFIQHLSVFSATEGANVVLNAIVKDDQTSAGQFAAVDGSPEYFKLFYKTTANQTWSAGTNAAQVVGDLFSFTIADANVGAAGTTLSYYLVANDVSNNARYFCAIPNATQASQCQTSPFVVNVVAAGARTIEGTIRSGGNFLGAARVFLGGVAGTAVSSDNGNGTYTLSGIQDNSPVDVIAYKIGYCFNQRQEFVGTGNLSTIDLNLNFGECSFGGSGQAGSGGKPHVMFSGPPEFATFVPLIEKIRVGLDQALNANTVNATQTASAVSSADTAYLTSGDGSNKVAGTMTYCVNQSTVGCSNIFAGDTNVILFSPTNALTAATQYTLVITEAVTSATGQSIEGNRQGGGHQISFTTQASSGGFTQTGGAGCQGAENCFDSVSFGNGGAFMPPFVQSMIPAPGLQAPPNTKGLLMFDGAMDTTSLTTTNIKLVKLPSTDIAITVTPDNTTRKSATISKTSGVLDDGEYELRVLGAVKSANGVAMRDPFQAGAATAVAFSGRFVVSGINDTGAPTIYPLVANNATGVEPNSVLEYGFSEQLNPSTITTSNITMTRGSTSVPISVSYDAGKNSVFVAPSSALVINTAYSITFGAGVTDLTGNAITAATYSLTVSSTPDTIAPKLRDVRCDDYSCKVEFTEPMNNKPQLNATNFSGSLLNHANITLVSGTNLAGTDLVQATGRTLTYDPANFSLKISGLATGVLVPGTTFTLRMESTTKDLAGNTLGQDLDFTGNVEDSKETFGTFDGAGMFGPPKASFGGAGGDVGAFEFKPQGFGTFTAEQFAFGTADTAFPFNQTASQDSNVFQVRFTPGVVVANGNQIILTFPSGTDVTNAAPDTFSSFFKDMNETFRPGLIGFDTAFSADGVSVDTTNRTVTIQLTVASGTPGANDQIVIDLRGITNPAIPKGPESGGYTLGIKLSQGGTATVNKTSMPYFIKAGGSRTITINIQAGAGPDNVSGTAFLHGGGPSGNLDKSVTITNGTGQAVFSSLNDGCYFFGTEPSVTIGANDYFGQMSPEPLCVNSTDTTKTKTITLGSTSGNSSTTLTVKFTGIANFGDVDMDIFAGGPGRFVVKNLTTVGVPEANGYSLKIPSDGMWFIGVGPGRPKGSTGESLPKPLPGTPPPPTSLNVAGVGGGSPTITSVQGQMPEGVTFDSTTKTLTISFASADKAVSGTVKDGSGTALQNVQVFLNSQGRGAPTFASTKSDGTFSISVSKFGNYEIGTMKAGMPPVFNNIEVQPDGSDAGSDIDIRYKGKQITDGNPLVLVMKKPAYTISGKVLDAASGGNGIAYAPINATNANGDFVGGMTDTTGSYSLFVDAGTWTIRAELPPSKTDSCGTYSKSVTITTESKASENITPAASTCYEITGTVTVGGTPLANVALFVNEWDTTNDRPAAGGTFTGSSTDGDGAYRVKVAGSKTYRIGTSHPDYGELSATKAVATADTTQDITGGATGAITFAFTGGTATQKAFIELKKSDSASSRLGKQKDGLNSDLTVNVPTGTYNYFVNVFGVSNFSGTVATGATATIDLSSTSMVTLAGNVNDGNTGLAADVPGALITARDASTNKVVATAVTDADGNYSMSLKSGTYKMDSSVAGYTAGETAKAVTLTSSNTSYDFGGAADAEQLGAVKSDKVITGTIYQSNGSTPITDGFVTATNATTGLTVNAPIDTATGTYALPVTAGTWAIEANGPLHAETLKTSTVTVTTADVAAQNITLTADASKVPTSSSNVITSETGGTINGTGDTDITLNVDKGILQSGAGSVTVEMEKNFTAPDTKSAEALGNASFDLSATGSNSSTIKDLTGNATIKLDYAGLLTDLPAGVTESALQLAYYSPERGEYVPVEGGFTVDTTNNTITGQVAHFTTFAIIYAPPVIVAASAGDSTPPAVPTNVKATSDGSKVTLTWTDPTDSDLTNIVILRNNGGSSPISGTSYESVGKGTGTYTDMPKTNPANSKGVTAGETYKYILRSEDSSGNVNLNLTEVSVKVETPAPAAPVTPSSPTAPAAPGVTPPLTPLAPTEKTPAPPTQFETPLAPNAPIVTERPVASIQTPNKIAESAREFKVALNSADITTLTSFVTNGTSQATIKLGSGERLAVVRDMLETLGRVSLRAIEQISAGEKPTDRNLGKEQANVKNALPLFKKMLGVSRAPNFKNTNEDLAWNTLMYRIRFTRDLAKERTGILRFKKVMGRNPSSPLNWAAVRAYGYKLAK